MKRIILKICAMDTSIVNPNTSFITDRSTTNGESDPIPTLLLIESQVRKSTLEHSTDRTYPTVIPANKKKMNAIVFFQLPPLAIVYPFHSINTFSNIKASPSSRIRPHLLRFWAIHLQYQFADVESASQLIGQFAAMLISYKGVALD